MPIGKTAVALSLALSLSLAPGAEAEAQQLFVGVTGGATYGDLFGGGINTDSRWGGTAGLTVGYRNLRYLVTQLEANWVQKGGGGVRLDYIEIPLLIGASGQYPNGLGARLYTGIGVAFPVGCSSDRQASFSCDADRKTEWAWPIGLQLGRWVDQGRFVAVDIRYSSSFTDAFEGALASNRSWQFRLLVGTPR